MTEKILKTLNNGLKIESADANTGIYIIKGNKYHFITQTRLEIILENKECYESLYMGNRNE